MKVGGQYYIETDYTKFKKLKSNRIVTASRLNNLIESFRGGAVLTLITVNKNMEIIDGQGRYEARKALGLPILYVIDPNTTIEDCRRINHFNKPWTAAEFIASYASDGNPNYINLYDICNELDMGCQGILRLANKTGNKTGNVFDGKLVFTEEDANTVRKVVTMAREISDALDFSGKKNYAFWIACKVAVETEGYDHKRMLENCRKLRMKYTQMSSLEDELKMFSQIYNYRNKTKKIYFEDYMRNRGYNVRSYDNNVLTKLNDQHDVSTLKMRRTNR